MTTALVGCDWRRMLATPLGKLLSTQVTNAIGPIGLRDEGPVKFDDFAKREVAHYASRRYNSRFF